MNPSFSLAGKVAIVTGASRWTGKTIALELARAGADVVVTARTVEGIEAAAAEIRGLGRRSLAVPADVRVTEQIDNLVRKTLEGFGRVDILVNNVGASFMAPALKLSEGGWDAMIRENLKPAFMCSRAVVESMMKQGGGTIINVASGEALRAAPSNPAYGAAKAGVVNLTMSLAVEWAPYGIRVNAVAPGFIETPILPQALAETPDLQETFSRVPLKRAGKLEEIAAPVVFLASDAANYVTGAMITVDGGLTCRM
jgi:NAD(P)-dependent dehydrogenase (short-subunit alcohol dehydrogenase family)